MATHTPGPWRTETWAYPAAAGKPDELVIIGEDLRLAVVTTSHDEENPFCVNHSVALKNLALMASAQLLLDALDRLQANPNDPRMHRLALDAMKAARGEI